MTDDELREATAEIKRLHAKIEADVAKLGMMKLAKAKRAARGTFQQPRTLSELNTDGHACAVWRTIEVRRTATVESGSGCRVRVECNRTVDETEGTG